VRTKTCSKYYCRVVVLHGKWYEILEIRIFTHFVKREQLCWNIVLLWSTLGCYFPFLIVVVGGVFLEHFRFLKSKEERAARKGKGTKGGGGAMLSTLQCISLVSHYTNRLDQVMIWLAIATCSRMLRKPLYDNFTVAGRHRIAQYNHEDMNWTASIPLCTYDKFYWIKPSLHNTIDSCILQLVTSATCFSLAWPSSGLQRLVSIKVHNVVVPMGSHGLHCLCVLY